MGSRYSTVPQTSIPALTPLFAWKHGGKLERYYRAEGRHDDVLIELPKGRYAPAFGWRETAVVTPAPAPEPAGGNTIAVLPFTNLSVAPDSEFFSDGLTWELIHRLTRIENLNVVAWNSAVQLRADKLDVYQVGETLKVCNVLAGSVRWAGNRLRVVVQLICTKTGVYLWSETYDRALEDVLSIQDDIARAIVETLRVRFAPQETKRPAYSFEAYQVYLRGRVAWNQRTESALLRSVECFRHATEIDPNFALAYAGVADALTLLAEYGFARASVVMPQAKAAATRALAIDPTLGEAYCSLAILLGVYEWNWGVAETHYRRALELNPGYATAHHFLADDCLAVVGRLEEALEEIDIARQLDPLSSIISEGRGFVLMLQRRYDEAERHYRALSQADPGFFKAHTSLGRTLLQMGRYPEAIECLNRGRALSGDVPSILGAIGQAYGLSGRADEARQHLGELTAMANNRYVPSSTFALIHTGLGENEQALEWLEKGVEQREMPMISLGYHPAYDSLRGEPRFARLLQRIGLGDSPKAT